MDRYIAEDYENKLWNMGFDAHITPNGNIRVPNGEYDYYLELAENTRSFKLTRDLWQAWTKDEIQHAIAAARTAEQKNPPAQIHVENGRVKAIVEVYLPSGDAFPDVFNDALDTITSAIDEFVHLMRVSLPRPPEQSLPRTKSTRAETYRYYLASMGYAAEVNKGEIITFTADGREYWLLPTDSWDKDLLIAAAYDIATVTKHADRARTAIIAARVTTNTPCVNVWLDRNGKVHATTELHLSDPMDFREEFPGCFATLQTVIDWFTAEMAGTKG